jgi:hypothetical protein
MKSCSSSGPLQQTIADLVQGFSKIGTLAESGKAAASHTQEEIAAVVGCSRM